jgi:hypothetical protein
MLPGATTRLAAIQAVVAEREEKASVAMASNESFSDPRLCAAIVDRLTFNTTVPLSHRAPNRCTV